jgi:hypothetical protein
MSPIGMDCADDFRVGSDRRTDCVDDLWVGSDAILSMIFESTIDKCADDFRHQS